MTVTVRDSDSEVLAREARFGVACRAVALCEGGRRFAKGRIRRDELDAAFGKTLDWHSRSEFHTFTELAVVLESHTGAAFVSQLNRHRCDHRTRG